MKSSTSKPLWFATFALLAVIGVTLKGALAFVGFTPSEQPVGWVAGDEMTNFDLRSGNEVLFRPEYKREYWDGNLIAYQVNSEANLSIATQPWSGGAAFQLDSRTTPRIIVTRDTAGTPIPFTWTNLDSTQKGYLVSSSILEFLRGNRSGEIQQGGTLRQRGDSALGDIIHSRPLYVSDSSAATVFVGANDGMLHAFDAATGAERWAYVPSMLISKMKNLAANPYVHDYYVDGSVNVATILAGTKRVLVGALGAGGRGLFALNITGSSRLAPATEADASGNSLWEITPSSTGFANLGYTYSNPIITQVDVSGSVTDVVIVGNGYNNSGDGKAYLYIINANTGALISAIATNASTGNGLSTPVAVDNDNDGVADYAFAGDLNGTMWKFDLTAATSTALLATSPAQPITMQPGVGRHPNGGYMVNFATGSMLTTADETDTSDFAAYGIWDAAPVANDTLLLQTLTEKCFTSGTAAAPSPCVSRVRTVTANQPDWTSGAGHHKGWKVVLPANNGTHGEKVVGDGSFIENGRFYFTATNPNISTTVQASTVKGENWLMELSYLTGGVSNSPFLDLSGDVVLTDNDRVKDNATPRAPIMSTDGIPVGKLISNGLMSQPILVQLSTLNNTLFNQNPDVSIVPVELGTGVGVTGGHFDVDIFYKDPSSAGAQSSATITIGTTGQISKANATLGTITVDGVVIFPALTVSDLPDGTATNTNANTLKSKVMNGFTATISGNVITVKAPTGSQYNGKAILVNAGTAQAPVVASSPGVTAVAGVTGVAPTNGTLVITAVGKDKKISIQCGGTFIGQSGTFRSLDSNSAGNRLNSLMTSINGTVNGYTTTCTQPGGSGTTLNCSIAAPVGVSACSATGFTVDSDITKTTNTGPQGGVNAVTAVTGSPSVTASGWTNFAPAVTATSFSTSGVEPVSTGDNCASTACKYRVHIHQYDDAYDVTGVNTLNPSLASISLKLPIPSIQQDFKILVQNQYLSPAVKLHIGDPTYLYNVDFGYTAVKDIQTGMTLDPAALQTYRRDPNAVWPGTAVTATEKLAKAKPIGSLAWNMPLDALTAKDWWGNSDIRVGLHPISYHCVWQAEGSNDGNMYKPVTPPAAGVDGPATKGWSTSTTPATATGARHNGALTVQIIRSTTPATAIELNVSGRSEFGWRVKSSEFANYVLAEYSTYWHHPNNKCYHDTGWSKTPGADTGTSTQKTKAAGSTDPHIGDLSAGSASGTGTITSTTTTVTGDVTTTIITYSGGSTATIQRTVNADGTVTIVTTDALGATTTQTIANAAGSVRAGGDERGSQARTGRISWRELVAQ
jgi:Tfp pilus tip-associated adhesin PilY1